MTSKDDYVFNRDAAASTRLNLQHYLWIASTGHLLHPSIPVPENALIADIGTGTGIFSLELAATLPPGARVEASDISLAQTPPRQWWPANVTFAPLDVFAPIPDSLRGRYDVVHIRLFMCVVQGGDPTPLLTNLLKLLKPGGYLQWQEYDAASDAIILADPASTAPKLSALQQATRVLGDGLDWISSLHERFPAHGAEVVDVVRSRTGSAHFVVKQDVTFLALREWAGMMSGRDPAKAKQVLGLVAEAEEECWAAQRGVAVDTVMITWVVKKL